MNLLSFLENADFVATIVMDSLVLCLAFSAYRSTKIRAFAFLVLGSVVGIILALGCCFHEMISDTSTNDGWTFWHAYRAAYLVACISWGIGIFQLIRHVVSGVERTDSGLSSSSAISQAQTAETEQQQLAAKEIPPKSSPKMSSNAFVVIGWSLLHLLMWCVAFALLDVFILSGVWGLFLVGLASSLWIWKFCLDDYAANKPTLVWVLRLIISGLILLTLIAEWNHFRNEDALRKLEERRNMSR